MAFTIPELETIRFSNSRSAKLARVSSNVNIKTLVNELSLDSPRALLILNGGTAKLKSNFAEKLSILFEELVSIVIRERITVITGGTNAGIFLLFGKALRKF